VHWGTSSVPYVPLSGLRRKSFGGWPCGTSLQDTASLSMIAVCGSTGPDTEPEPPQTAIMETVSGYMRSTRPPTLKDLRHGPLRVPKCIGSCSNLAEPDYTNIDLGRPRLLDLEIWRCSTTFGDLENRQRRLGTSPRLPLPATRRLRAPLPTPLNEHIVTTQMITSGDRLNTQHRLPSKSRLSRPQRRDVVHIRRSQLPNDCRSLRP